MRTIEDVLELNKQPAYIFTAEASILETIQSINHKEMRVLLWIEAGNMIVMKSNGDLKSKVILARKSLNEWQLREILAKMVIYPSNKADDGEPITHAQEQYFRNIPIMLGGFLTGEILIEDFTRIIFPD